MIQINLNNKIKIKKIWTKIFKAKKIILIFKKLKILKAHKKSN